MHTTERTRVIDAVHEVLAYVDYQPEIKLMPEMPTGPYNRVADNTLANTLLGWAPTVCFKEGLHKTIDWYYSDRRREEVASNLEAILSER